MSEEWTFATRAEMSGFGVGGDRLQWIVTTGFDYQPWTQTSFTKPQIKAHEQACALLEKDELTFGSAFPVCTFAAGQDSNASRSP